MFLIQISCKGPDGMPRILPRWRRVHAVTMEEAILARLRTTRPGALKRVLRRRRGAPLYAVVAPAHGPNHAATGMPMIVQGFLLSMNAIADPSLN